METLEITDAEYIIGDAGYPALQFKLNGRTILLDGDVHPILHNAHIVALGDGQAGDLVPPIKFKPPDGGPITLIGCTRDPRIWRMLDDFLKVMEFKAGPIEIPDWE